MPKENYIPSTDGLCPCSPAAAMPPRPPRLPRPKLYNPPRLPRPRARAMNPPIPNEHSMWGLGHNYCLKTMVYNLLNCKCK